jgi:hypothetical protein
MPADQVRDGERPPASADVRFWLAVAGLTLLGGVLRVMVAHQSVFADELSTYWISVTHSLGGVLSLMYSTGRIHHAEISPPLSFLASWLTTRPGTSPELLRLPALVAGIGTIPMTYLVGIRMVGRRAALLATTITTLSPFMIYYSAEARAYGLMMFFVLAAVLSMLLAIDTRRPRYWVLYAICSAAAFYSHYTCVFVLGVVLVWLLWTESWARRQAILANLGAVLLVVPWIPGLIQDERSPTVRILSALSPFTPHAVKVDIEHWAIGYPYAQSRTLPSVATGLARLPGVPALVLLGIGGLVAVLGVAYRARRGELRVPLRSAVRTRAALALLLLLATPVGEAAASAVGNHIIGVRDLAASWPFLALFAAAFALAGGRRLGLAAAALGIIAFALSVPKMLAPDFQRPNYQAAAGYVTSHAKPGDVVLDETGGLSPGPLTGFDVAYHGPLTVVRAHSPAERDHPYTLFDPIVPVQTGIARAISDARGARLFIVGAELPGARLPQGYRLVTTRNFPGLERTLVGVYSPTPGAR